MLAGLSQQDAAQQLQISQQTVGSWETGRTLPQLEAIYGICLLYGIAPGYLVLAQATPQMSRYDHCPPEGRPVCKALAVGQPCNQ